MIAAGPTAPASTPPSGLPGLDPSWSRLVTATDADGVERTWHVLDTHAGVDAGGAVGTLLCVHGNPTWSYLWRDLLASAPDGWRVVAVDHLDMGYSERTGTVRGLQRRIDDLGVVTAALGLRGPVVTVAHDWGGPISLGWALAHRASLAGVVLTNTAVHQPADAAAPRLIRLARSPGLLATVCERTDTFVRGTTALSRPRPPRAVRDAYAAPYATADRRAAIAGFVRDIPLEPDHPSASALDAVAAGLADLRDVPALLVWGAADPVFGDRYLHDLEARLPHARVHRHVTASHLVVEDADVASTVRTWLAADLPEVCAPGRGSDDLMRTPAGESAEVAAADAPGAAAAADAPGAAGNADAPGNAGTAADAADGPERAPLWSALDDPALAEERAIVEGERAITFGDLGARVRDVAAGLAASGVAAGDRVALLVPPGIDLATSLYACWRIGAVVVLADAGLGARGITHALRSAAPDHLIGIPKALAAAATLGWPGRRIAAGDVPPAVLRATSTSLTLDGLAADGADRDLPTSPGPDDDAAVVFTSGATGPAKGVAYRHRQVQAQRDALVTTYAITRDDRLAAAFAPFALYGPAMGITSIVPDMDVTAPSTLTAAALAEAVAAVDATLVFASPAALANVLATADGIAEVDRPALSRVRLLLSAGAPVPAELLRALGAVLPAAEPHTPYGMTEALPVADISLAQIEAAGVGDGVCVGHPVAGVEVVVAPIDDLGRVPDGAVLTSDPDVVGELCVRADHAKDRYDRLWATEQAASRFAGWHRSGDVGHLDAQGRIWVGGRLVHVITTPAGVVTPVGIERRVEAVGDARTGTRVRLAAAVGVGPVGAQQVVVVVQSDPPVRTAGLAPTVLTAAVRAVLPDVPVAAVLVVPALPVDIRHNSKIDRARVARWASSLLAGERVGAP